MKAKIRDIDIKFSFYFFAVLSLMMVIGENKNTLFIFLFCICHEIGHLLGMYILKKKPKKIEIGYFGIKIISDINTKSNFKVTIIFLLGPITNLILFIIFYFFGNNDLGLINIVLCIFNMLPVEQLDGGRIIALYFSENTLKIISFTISIIIIVIGLIVVLFNKSNFSFMFVGIYLLIGLLNK